MLYYAFPVLSADLIADTGWSRSAVTAAFSVALVISGIMRIPVGRVFDRSGPHGGDDVGGVQLYAVIINLVPVTEERGLSTATAAWPWDWAAPARSAGRLTRQRTIGQPPVAPEPSPAINSDCC